MNKLKLINKINVVVSLWLSVISLALLLIYRFYVNNLPLLIASCSLIGLTLLINISLILINLKQCETSKAKSNEWYRN